MCELGPLDEQLVEDQLVDPQDERRLQSGHRSRSRRGHKDGELAHRGSGTELVEGAAAAVHSHSALDDGVEVRLDGALLHQHVSLRCALLNGSFRNGCQNPPRNAGEHLHAVERRDALDEAERARRRRRDVRHGLGTYSGSTMKPSRRSRTLDGRWTFPRPLGAIPMRSIAVSPRTSDRYWRRGSGARSRRPPPSRRSRTTAGSSRHSACTRRSSPITGSSTCATSPRASWSSRAPPTALFFRRGRPIGGTSSSGSRY